MHMRQLHGMEKMDASGISEFGVGLGLALDPPKISEPEAQDSGEGRESSEHGHTPTLATSQGLDREGTTEGVDVPLTS